MHNFKAILALLSVALLPSCLLGDFDDIKGDTYVKSHEKGSLPDGVKVTDFGAALIPTAGDDGLSYYIVSRLAPTLLHVNFAIDGERDKNSVHDLIANTFPGATTLVEQPTVASDTASFSDPNQTPMVALGIKDGDDAKAVILNATHGQPIYTQLRFTLIGGQEPKSLAFGTSDAASVSNDGTDLVAVAAAELNLVADYQSDTVVVSCSLPSGAGGGKLLLADVDSSTAGSEIIVSNDSRLIVTPASRVQQANTAAEACFPTVADFPQIAAPSGATGFGDVLAQGDFDGNGVADIVVAAPGSNGVYVYMNWTVQAPSAAVQIPTPSGANTFGTTLAVGDFDNDGKSELVVGDPEHDVGKEQTKAGKVYIYSSTASGSFSKVSELHDSRADKNQIFGRSLAVVRAFGRDKLVVGTKNEVFTYFKTPLDGDVDFRP